MVQAFGQNNVATFAYSFLLSDPREKIAPRLVARLSRPSPWPIEYARRAKLRGDGPTLAIHKSGGTMGGRLLVMDVVQDRIGEVGQWLWKREGTPACA
jgi:hypothetical protein